MESPGQAGRHSIIFSAAIYLTASGDGGQQRKEQKKQREVGRETIAAQNARKLKPVCRLMAKGRCRSHVFSKVSACFVADVYERQMKGEREKTLFVCLCT